MIYHIKLFIKYQARLLIFYKVLNVKITVVVSNRITKYKN